MKISEADILIAPGLGNSGPDHWQRRWGRRMANARFIEQDDWDEPVLGDWVGRIHQEIMLATRPVVLIGHSLATAAIVHTAQRLADTKVRGAFLVSPPDFESDALPETAKPFGNVPFTNRSASSTLSANPVWACCVTNFWLPSARISMTPPLASAAQSDPSRSARMHSGRCKSSPT